MDPNFIPKGDSGTARGHGPVPVWKCRLRGHRPGIRGPALGDMGPRSLLGGVMRKGLVIGMVLPVMAMVATAHSATRLERSVVSSGGERSTGSNRAVSSML